MFVWEMKRKKTPKKSESEKEKEQRNLDFAAVPNRPHSASTRPSVSLFNIQDSTDFYKTPTTCEIDAMRPMTSM